MQRLVVLVLCMMNLVMTQMQMAFTLSGVSLNATVEVRWHRLEQSGDDGLSPGMGVRFLNLTDAEQATINEFIDKRETLFFLDD